MAEDPAVRRTGSPFPSTVEGDLAHEAASAKAIADLLGSCPVDVADTVRGEVEALARANDEVLHEPLGLVDNPVVRITASDIEDAIRVEHGPVWKRDGELVVKDQSNAWLLAGQVHLLLRVIIFIDYSIPCIERICYYLYGSYSHLRPNRFNRGTIK